MSTKISVLPRIPKHVAIIMDGNGRWAVHRNRPRFYGHIRGASRVREIIEEANRIGIKALTLYAFSSENWSRPNSELSILWRLMRKFMVRYRKELQEKNVKLHVIGEFDRLAPALQSALRESIDSLSGNTGMQLTIALSYGGRAELTNAARSFTRDCLAGKRRPEDLNEKLMNDYLWTARLGALSNVDLLIRTSGELRISNFLLWQSAYAEFIFPSVCWPDFSSEHFRSAIEEYSRRDRRFGGIKEQPGATRGVLA